MRDLVWYEALTLTSTQLSANRLASVPMPGCSGHVAMTWVRLPGTGISMLVSIRPLIGST